LSARSMFSPSFTGTIIMLFVLNYLLVKRIQKGMTPLLRLQSYTLFS